MKATLKFSTLEGAKHFTQHWVRKTLTGYDQSSVQPDGSVEVTVYDVVDKKTVIDDYVVLTMTRDNV